MNVQEFIEKLIKIADTDPASIEDLYQHFLHDFDGGDLDGEDLKEDDKERVRKRLKRLGNEASGSFEMKMERCLNICKAQKKKLSSKDESLYAKKVRKLYTLLRGIETVFHEVQEKRSTKNSNSETTREQNDEYIKEIRVKLVELNNAVADANKLIDDKIFAMLINTVTILGIFVAIAFTGFSVTTLFSNIDFGQAVISQGNFIKSVFFLILVSWLSYNLLLLLIYFIYKLSRPLKAPGENEAPESFRRAVKLKYFLWIDAGIFIVVIGLFFWCQSL